jgi:uncharacterized RDD family membrane protein YckC
MTRGDVDQTGVVLRRYALYVTEMVVLVVGGLVSFVLALFLGWLVVWLGAPPIVFFILPFAGMIVVMLVGTVWIEVWYPYRHDGATLGRRWFDLRIVTVEGGIPVLRDYLVRWLLMVVDGMFFGLVGAILIAVTPRRQRLGDIVARTVVVRAGKVS